MGTEGKATWLLVGLIAALFLLTPLWIRFGGKDPGPLAPIPENPVLMLQSGQKFSFAAGDLKVGTGLVCEHNGVVTGAWVPRPGHTTSAHLTGLYDTASISIHVRRDGVVIARCA